MRISDTKNSDIPEEEESGYESDSDPSEDILVKNISEVELGDKDQWTPEQLGFKVDIIELW